MSPEASDFGSFEQRRSVPHFHRNDVYRGLSPRVPARRIGSTCPQTHWAAQNAAGGLFERLREAIPSRDILPNFLSATARSPRGVGQSGRLAATTRIPLTTAFTFAHNGKAAMPRVSHLSRSKMIHSGSWSRQEGENSTSPFRRRARGCNQQVDITLGQRTAHGPLTGGRDRAGATEAFEQTPPPPPGRRFGRRREVPAGGDRRRKFRDAEKASDTGAGANHTWYRAGTPSQTRKAGRNRANMSWSAAGDYSETAGTGIGIARSRTGCSRSGNLGRPLHDFGVGPASAALRSRSVDENSSTTIIRTVEISLHTVPIALLPAGKRRRRASHEPSVGA